MITDICMTIDEIFPSLPIKRKAEDQGSRDSTPSTPGGRILTQQEFETANRAIWEEASAAQRRKDRVAQGKREQQQNCAKRDDWGLNTSYSLHVVKPTFSPTPEESSASSNAIPNEALPGSNTMDTDTPATDSDTI